MFTGLVEETGVVTAISSGGSGKRLNVTCKRVLEDLAVDHSVSVNGVCLTVVERTAQGFAVDVIAETLSKTTIGNLQPSQRVNLERAVRLSDRLGGHLVQGHADTTGTVDAIVTDGSRYAEHVWDVWIRFDPAFRKWLIPVGSVCVDGVSLTVAQVEDTRFKVSIIPHTLQVTTLGTLQVQSTVNLEFDVLAKYIESIHTYGG